MILKTFLMSRPILLVLGGLVVGFVPGRAPIAAVFSALMAASERATGSPSRVSSVWGSER
jgi:hypothetical protein